MNEIRLLRPADVPQAFELSDVAGWNQTAQDWASLIELEPEGCFGIEEDGRLVATATMVCYEARLAWLGMVLTHPDYRRRGFARRLVTAALEFARERRVATVKLDATRFGVALYESLGFEMEQPVERWFRGGLKGSVGLGNGDWEIAARLDGEAFGANRRKLFASFRSRAQLFAAADGFLMTRAGARATYVGPMVAGSVAAARELVRSFLAANDGPFFWDILTANVEAVGLALEFGFMRNRELMRMVRGPEVVQDSSIMYGIAGFEFG